MLQNRMEIFKGAKDEMIQEGFIHKLVIKKLIAKDAGNYTLSCDGVTTSCNVSVKGKNTMFALVFCVWHCKPLTSHMYSYFLYTCFFACQSWKLYVSMRNKTD